MKIDSYEKNDIFPLNIFHFFAQNCGYILLVRTASLMILTSTYNVLCFGAKIRKMGLHIYYKKWDVRGYTHYKDLLS